MKACATNTLQPIWFKAGVEGLFSPSLVPRLAACAVNCAICGSVCPTGAIRKLPVEEKIQAKIGTAWIDRQNCLVWNRDKKCLVCGEVCPYHAISFQPASGRRNGVPIVHANRCCGCGWCENKCPVEGAGAIRVSVVGEIRLSSGSYIEKAKEYGLEFKVADKKFDKLAPDTFESTGIDEERRDPGEKFVAQTGKTPRWHIRRVRCLFAPQQTLLIKISKNDELINSRQFYHLENSHRLSGHFQFVNYPGYSSINFVIFINVHYSFSQTG